jgi:hypothetical protein
MFLGLPFRTKDDEGRFVNDAPVRVLVPIDCRRLSVPQALSVAVDREYGDVGRRALQYGVRDRFAAGERVRQNRCPCPCSRFHFALNVGIISFSSDFLHYREAVDRDGGLAGLVEGASGRHEAKVSVRTTAASRSKAVFHPNVRACLIYAPLAEPEF